MAALSEGESSENPGQGFNGDTPVAWAAERFGFDRDNRRGRQPGVESLQKWLIGEGAKVAADGVFGPGTQAALEQIYWSGVHDAFIGVKPEAVAKAAHETAQQAYEETPDPEPTPSTPSAAVAAKPVALSDSAIEDVAQDRLGFRPYVEAVAEFILAEQTRPPLALAINAPWGQGKTSFMRMLDAQLKRQAPQTTMRIATTWFNPWKYSEPEQVWAAFVANVTRCLRDHLTPWQSWRFRLKRLGTKLHRHADLSFVLRVLVALIFLSLVVSVAFMDWSRVPGALLEDQKLLRAFYTAATSASTGYLWYLPLGLLLLLGVVYAYVAVSNKLGLNLLEYVEKTGFKDKIGTLSQFEHEMLKLREAVPDDLKVVAFIDDLDRCKGKVLGEIIEALQLAEVSHTCIFVMGMDMHIVAHAIESERAELAQSVGGATRMEHGCGYKFLEKIIQARLTLPVQGPEEMEQLIAEAMARDEARDRRKSKRATPPPRDDAGQPAHRPTRIVEQVRRRIGLAAPRERQTPSDSEAVIATAKHYGSRHFDNPRRLKRFINGFRLQTYLTAAVRPGATPIDRLARFLVLAEKWPAVIDYLLEHELGSIGLMTAETEARRNSMRDQITQLPTDEQEKLAELLAGQKRGDPLDAEEWKDLADWYGFAYYRGIVPEGSA